MLEVTVLQGHLITGTVWVEDHTYFGRASDGQVVNLGSTSQPEQVDAYLKEHPTPETW